MRAHHNESLAQERVRTSHSWHRYTRPLAPGLACLSCPPCLREECARPRPDFLLYAPAHFLVGVLSLILFVACVSLFTLGGLIVGR